VLQPIDGDALEESRERTREKLTQLDEHEAEMPAGITVDAAPLGGAALGKDVAEIRQRQPPSAREEGVRDVADAAAHPRRHR